LPSLYLNTRFVIDETAACKAEGMICDYIVFENMWLELGRNVLDVLGLMLLHYLQAASFSNY